ncbi:putative purine-cytosine permease FCY2 [Coleophoma crateriformis]|uniref:Putative purine-cytosine permease FCY2 n=1 Tax=Coleophoma crateriformis TaxID=565419 RepID=A0A3D8SZD6_9HELO|nr:putative purine-cytosine permease FCY2 [Coleophoma crateriformis]
MSVYRSTDGESSPTSAKVDEEKNLAESTTNTLSNVAVGESTEIFGQLSVWQKLANCGVELRGVEPVPEAERTDTRYLNVGTWLGASMLNLLPCMGFTMISAVVGGQCLVAVSDNSLSTNSGIAIIAIISMVLTVAGYKIMHVFLRYAWIPSVVSIIISVGVGGKHLKHQATVEPLTAQTVITFASLIAGYMIPFAGTLGDYVVYMPPNAPRLRIFLYAWLGICIPSVTLMTLGAAIGATVSVTPSWSDAYNLNSIGGVMSAMLEPAGGFGKFVTLILALSVISNTAPSVYSLSLNFQVLAPGLYRIPRIIHVIISTGILIGVGIGAAEKFINSLESFLGVISYWSAGFVGIQLVEWLVFRHRDPATYDQSIWNNKSLLPSGIPALISLILPFAIVVPSMDQVWYVGPIATKTGDLGFEFALVITPFIYYPLRKLEMKYFRNGCL